MYPRKLLSAGGYSLKSHWSNNLWIIYSAVLLTLKASVIDFASYVILWNQNTGEKKNKYHDWSGTEMAHQRAFIHPVTQGQMCRGCNGKVRGWFRLHWHLQNTVKGIFLQLQNVAWSLNKKNKIYFESKSKCKCRTLMLLVSNKAIVCVCIKVET